jgi:AcrR family transcriptional regulator
MPVLGRTKQEVLSEFRSSEILEAARKVFAKKGFSQATVEEIAEAAEVAKGTVYLYFPSKRAIYLAALRHGIEALHDRTKGRLAAAGSTEKKLKTFIETRIEYFDENRDFFKIYYSELANIFSYPSQMDASLQLLYSKQAKMLESVLKEGIQRGEIRPLATGPTAFAIYDLIRGVIARRLLDGSKTSGPDETAFLLDLVWKGIEK